MNGGNCSIYLLIAEMEDPVCSVYNSEKHLKVFDLACVLTVTWTKAGIHSKIEQAEGWGVYVWVSEVKSGN